MTSSPRHRLPIGLLLGLFLPGLALPAVAQESDLPRTMAAPPANPEVPEAPAAPGRDGDAKPLPHAPPTPSTRPEEPDSSDRDAATREPAAGTEAKPVQGPPPPPGQLDGKTQAAERACRARLKALKVAFSEPEPPRDGNGCALPFPVEVTAFGEITVEPALLVNCATAETTARYLRDVVQREAKKSLGKRVSAIANGSGYVCRPRNGTTTLSEHALGNAVDIMGFVLEDDRRLDVATMTGKAEAAFLKAIRASACGPFKTVLGPGADADHADHLHLDLAKRRNGGTFCQ